MKTHVLYFTMLLSFISSGVFAQENPTPKIHQVGITFSSLNQFGMNYKTGSEKTLLRLSLLSLNLGNDSQWGKTEDSLDVKQQNYGAGFRLGFEKRVPVVTHFDFIWGLEAGINYNYQKTKFQDLYNDYERTSWNIMPLVNVILGVNYTIGEHLVIGAEITPGFHYSVGKTEYTSYNQTKETTSSSFGFGFNNNSANLSVAYRFGK